MRNKKILYIVLDSSLLFQREEKNFITHTIKGLIIGGADIIQLRAKELTDREFFILASKIKNIIKNYSTLKNDLRFLINDRVDIAKLINADGVHLGQEDIPPECARRLLGKNKLIGLSCHNQEDINYAKTQPIDYISIGSVFSSSTKKELKPLGIDEFKRLLSLSFPIPVIAIGGINDKNILQFKGLNIKGVAIGSFILKNINIEESTKNIKDLLNSIS
jgi:thiamine-phosphate pyrophosphorylase